MNTINSPLLHEFSLIKFHPQQVILIHNKTRRHYNYYQKINQNQNQSKNCSLNNKNKNTDNNERIKVEVQQIIKKSNNIHPSLIPPIIISENIILYLKYYNTLQTIIKANKKHRSTINFTNQEIINTFTPIIQILYKIHQHNLVHGNLTPSHILFNDQAQIQLKHWYCLENFTSQYYLKNIDHQKQKQNIKNVKDDWKALAYIILQTITFQQIKKIIKNPIFHLIKIYKFLSKPVIIALIIMLNQIQQEYSNILSILQQQKKPSFKLQQQFQMIFNKKDNQIKQKLKHQNLLSFQQIQNIKAHFKKTHHQENIQKNQKSYTQTNILNQVIDSEKNPQTSNSQRKFIIKTPTKKQNKIENYQNKRFHQQIKKRSQLDKISKIKQRSNTVVNQIVSKKIIQSVNKNKNHAQAIGIKNIVLGNQNNFNKKAIIDYSKFSTSPIRKTGVRFMSKKK